ncbi:helix-turn-helix domain-containing protein [Streptosporangium sp. NPDC002607]
MRAHGWTQEQLAEAVGYSQSWVSKVLRHRQPLTIDQVREISGRLGVPLHLLRFGHRGDDDPTKRRDFGKAVALAALTVAPTPIQEPRRLLRHRRHRRLLPGGADALRRSDRTRRPLGRSRGPPQAGHRPGRASCAWRIRWCLKP